MYGSYATYCQEILKRLPDGTQLLKQTAYHFKFSSHCRCRTHILDLSPGQRMPTFTTHVPPSGNPNRYCRIK
jgi:hypothetical protein